MTEDQKQQLQSKLWAVADILRGRMDADDFRDYMLGFIFYKYLSEKMETYADRILEQNKLNFIDVNESTPDGPAILDAVKVEAVEDLGYYLHPSELFDIIAGRGQNRDDPSGFILDDLRRILRSIENSTMGAPSQEDFDHLFEDLDLSNSRLGRTEGDRNDIIARVLTTLQGIDFKLDDADSDILGDAYEYLISKFAANAGKSAGEFYTPPQVSTILARIVATDTTNGAARTKEKITKVYDPTCGSGSLLLRFGREGIDVGQYFGQEMNRTTYNLARMNMILHDVHYSRFDLRLDDTIEHPADAHRGKKFEAVVANPPFSARWSAVEGVFRGDPRFSDFPRLPPKAKADYCFVLHMLSHLDDNGVMAVILPHGALFRGAAEGEIREHLIGQKNWLDAVIGLPANVFFGTSIPACIMVFKKCREIADDIMFIDASQHFQKVKNQNHLRDEDVDRVVDAYRGRAEIERYARPVALAEIAENDFNLNIPRYVDTSEAEEVIDLDAVTGRLKGIDQDLATNAGELRAFCDELGIEPPV